MATTWRLSSFESATDVKELIPEFFFLPEFLENSEGNDTQTRSLVFSYGKNNVVGSVQIIPEWIVFAKNLGIEIN